MAGGGAEDEHLPVPGRALNLTTPVLQRLRSPTPPAAPRRRAPRAPAFQLLVPRLPTENPASRLEQLFAQETPSFNSVTLQSASPAAVRA